jgi:peptide subunit release factor 1 (eRF1)
VVALTKDTIRILAAFQSPDVPVVSLYLDVDGRRRPRPQEYERQLDRMVRDALGSFDDGRPASRDLERIAAHVHRGLDRSRVRGLALFSCESAGLWEALELPIPVCDELVVNRSPQVAQLERLSQEHRSFGVLLADRQRARVLVIEMGEVAHGGALFDELPRHEDDRGEWDKDHVHGHQAVAAQHHLRRAGQLAFSVFKRRGFDHLVLSGPESVLAEVERELHSYLRDRIVARLSIPTAAGDDEVRQAVLRVEEQVERDRECALVRSLRERLSTGTAVAGLGPVLQALLERRVEALLVSPGFRTAGWRCPRCAALAERGRRCAVCSAPMDRVDDVVEEAVGDAVSRCSCQVVTCVDSADLDVQGRIGALLRY